MAFHGGCFFVHCKFLGGGSPSIQQIDAEGVKRLLDDGLVSCVCAPSYLLCAGTLHVAPQDAAVALPRATPRSGCRHHGDSDSHERIPGLL